MADQSIEEAIKAEIESLHSFFVEWFAGRASDTDEAFSAGFIRRLDPRLTYVMPDGSQLGISGLCDMLRSAHGTNPDFKIAISDVLVRAEVGDLVVATYLEWQTNARNSKPVNNGRISTAIFINSTDGLRWLHVHETWVPEVLRTTHFR